MQAADTLASSIEHWTLWLSGEWGPAPSAAVVEGRHAHFLYLLERLSLPWDRVAAIGEFIHLASRVYSRSRDAEHTARLLRTAARELRRAARESEPAPAPPPAAAPADAPEPAPDPPPHAPSPPARAAGER